MTESKPRITGTTHTLPFDKLSPREFERLCLWLVEREGYKRAEHPGAAGSEQGLDIVAWREDTQWAFQCKRVQRFGPKDALAEVEKVLALPKDQRPVALVFLVTCVVSAKTRRQARERCAREMECHFWAGTELDEKVKRHPDILEEFFQLAKPSLWERLAFWLKRLLQRPLIRYPALALVLLALAVISMNILFSFRPAFGDEILIVIASFYHSEGIPDTEAHNEIRRAIKEAADELGFSHLRVEVEPTRLTSDDRIGAEKLGKRYSASMVIWGADTGVRIAVNHLNLKQPDFDAAEVKINETERTQLANPSAYASFVTQDLPGQLTFLSLFAIGQSYYIEENYEEAIAVIEEAVNSLTSDVNLPEGVAEAYFRLGWLYQDKLLNDERAIAAYSKAIEMDPQMVAAYSNRAFAYAVQSLSGFGQDDPNVALADFDRVVELSPDDARAYCHRGMIRLAQVVAQSHSSGKVILNQDVYYAALTDFSQAIELDPDYAYPYISRGDIYQFWGDSYAAIADFDKAIELNPDDADIYQKRGRAYRSLGELDTAMADFDKAIELDPRNAALYYDRGSTHLSQSNLDAALTDYNTGIELESELVASPDNLDNGERAQDESDEVVYRYQMQFAFTGSKPAETYHTRGTILAMLGRLNEAITDYDKAIELDPGYPEAYYNRGAVLSQLGRLVSALADFDKAVELDPDFADAYYGRGVVHRQFDDADAALADFCKYLELRPNTDNRAQIDEWIAELEAELSDK